MSQPGPSVTIVIPALDEAETLPGLLADIAGLEGDVVVVDGGSLDGTPAVAADAGARVVTSARGRGVQMRTGAAASQGEWLLFLHADSRIDPAALQAVRDHVAAGLPKDFGHFSFALDGNRRLHRVIEAGQRVRERLFGLVYGDQGLLVSRTLYDGVGGYPDWVIMEDVGLVDRLGRAGRRIRLDGRLRTSPRRYDSEGGIRAWLRNMFLIAAFRAGVSPSLLARWYPPHVPHRPAPPPSRDERAVIVFAKAPVEGRVKTRLAASIGDAEAVRIYRTLAERTVSALRDGPWRLCVYLDPGSDDLTQRATALETVKEWFGTDGIEYRLQRSGDLGARMSAAFTECFAACREACIVGTDLPDMQAAWVAESFQKLRRADVVLGPATDGGYYLMALGRPAPELFRNIEWSTSDVLPTTLDLAARAGMAVVQLAPRTDVDTVDDLPRELLAR